MRTVKPGPPDSDGRSVAIADVAGGVTGLAASTAAMTALAGTMGGVGLRLAGRAAIGAATAADTDLALSAPVAPETFAVAEAALLRAVAGPEGSGPDVAAWELLAVGVRRAAAMMTAADELVRGWWLGLAEQALAVGAPGIAALGGLAGAATGQRPSYALAGLLGTAYLTGTGHRTVPRPDLTVPGLARQPRGVEGLVTVLAQTSTLSAPGAERNNGTVAVQTLVTPDGGRRHVVYLPGTDDLRPWSRDSDVRDWATNLRLTGNRPTAYAAGVLDAMAQAGIRPGEPVLLAGHSQGGMQAAALLSHGTPYAVTDVVTVGSPTAQLEGRFPSGTQVLSLENAGDLVPKSDGADNPDTVAQVTVTFATRDTGMPGNHDLTHYVAGAAAVDASAHPSVVAAVDGLDDFLSGQLAATGQVFQIVRVKE